MHVENKLTRIQIKYTHTHIERERGGESETGAPNATKPTIASTC